MPEQNEKRLQVRRGVERAAGPDADGGGGGAVTSLNYQAVHTGVFVGIARNALDDAVEFVVRMIHSLLIVPGHRDRTEAALRRYLRTFVLPALLSDPPAARR